jgi:lipoyl(octanoyl) transferase
MRRVMTSTFKALLASSTVEHHDHHFSPPLLIRHWRESVPYQEIWQQMRALTHARDAQSLDEFWFLEHSPVFTLGQAGRIEHVLAAGDIPVLHCDRGGQVTYHGPGQQIVYVLLNLHRLGFGIRSLVQRLEQAVIDVLALYQVAACVKPDAPGVYVGDAKIASLGLRIHRGFTYHGLAFNVDMDLKPFAHINPCGYPGLKVTQLRECAGPIVGAKVRAQLAVSLRRNLGYEELATA